MASTGMLSLLCFLLGFLNHVALCTDTVDTHWYEFPHRSFKAGDEDIKKNFISATLGSNMVLQRDQPAVLWGYDTEPGSTVTAALMGRMDIIVESVQTQAGDDGFWRVKLPPQPASKISTWIEVHSTSGKIAKLENILYGDVYICGGQSNMGFSLPVNTNATEEIKKGNQYPHIRIFTVGQNTSSDVPLDDLQTIRQRWSVANETSLNSTAPGMFTYFSSVCWFFGRTVADGLDNEVPIGLISNNWGGTRIELWHPGPGGKLWNAMIHPYTIGPMALTGFTWYQGESNSQDKADADKYAYHFPSMIKSWREGFASPEAYFGFVQLSASCHPPAMAEVREAQMKALDRVPGKIAYSTNADRGDGCNIHPPAKQYCGKRLGRSALALQYGQSSIHWKSPSYLNAQPSMDGDTVSLVISLQDVSPQGLYLIGVPFSIDPNRPSLENPKTRCEELEPGTCAGAQLLLTDGKGWVNATITITGTEEVTLTAEVEISRTSRSLEILNSRYGFAQIPLLTIYDRGTDLPVLPWSGKAAGASPDQTAKES